MNKAMLMITQIFDKPFLIERLEEKIAEWKAVPTDDNYQSILAVCHMLMTKDVIEKEGLDTVDNKMQMMDSVLKKIDNTNPNELKN